jgi:hypothetical protein
LHVDPGIPHDAEQPAVDVGQAGCIAPRGHGSNNRVLHEVIGLMPIAGQRPRETAESWQEQHHTSPHLLVGRAFHVGTDV